MHRLLEIILGLERGFLSREGDLSLQFNPAWPGQAYVGAVTWNLVLIALAAFLVWHVYRREGRSRNVRIVLGVVRGFLLGFLIVLLNRPVLTLGQSRTEPSVVAVMIDDSISMRVRDAGNGADGKPLSRIEAVAELLSDHDKSLLKELSKVHQVRFFRFDRDKESIDAAAVAKITPQGQNTQVLASLRSVLSDLQGASYRLIDRRLHTFKVADVDRIAVTVGGKTQDLKILNRESQNGYKLAPAKTPDKPEEMARNWHDKIWRIYPVEILGKGEKPTPAEPKVTLRVEYFDGKKSAGFIEVGKIDAAPAAPVSESPTGAHAPEPPKPDLYARTEHTAGWIKIHNDPSYVTDGEKVVSGPQ